MSRRKSGRLELAVMRAARASKLTHESDGAVELARQYAAAIDGLDPEVKPVGLVKVGPKLLEALDALGLTPKARTALLKGAAPQPSTTPLDELRAARERRGSA